MKTKTKFSSICSSIIVLGLFYILAGFTTLSWYLIITIGYPSASMKAVYVGAGGYRVPSRAVASLSLPGGQDKNISSIFPHFPVFSLILLHFGTPGGPAAHPRMPWLRYWFPLSFKFAFLLSLPFKSNTSINDVFLHSEDLVPGIPLNVHVEQASVSRTQPYILRLFWYHQNKI